MRRASPSTATYEYGGSGSWTRTTTDGSARMFAAFTVSCQVVNTISPPSTAYHVGVAWGRPSGRTDANVAVRLPSPRNAHASSSDIFSTIADLLGRGADRRDDRRRKGAAGPKRTAVVGKRLGNGGAWT